MTVTEIYLVIEIKRPDVVGRNVPQGQSTAVLAALQSRLPVVTVYTDLVNSWTLIWCTNEDRGRQFQMMTAGRAAAVATLRSWVQFNDTVAMGNYGRLRRRRPPAPFQDIRKFNFTAAADPKELGGGDDSDDDYQSALLTNDERRGLLLRYQIKMWEDSCPMAHIEPGLVTAQ